MRVQVLVATMHQKDYSLLEKMNIQSDAVIINQCDSEGGDEFSFNSHNILWVNTKERGLSKSRNMAIRYASGDICVIADDDEVFCAGYAETIRKVFKRHPRVAIIRFMVRGIERPFKVYQDNEFGIGYRKSMQSSSVELAFRLSLIKASGIKFDERIGAGTKFLMGEENVFLFDSLRKGLKLRFVPCQIADLHIEESTWFTGYNKEYFIARGASYAALKTPFTFLFILYFALFKYKLYKGNVTLMDAMKYMRYGSREYRSLKN